MSNRNRLYGPNGAPLPPTAKSEMQRENIQDMVTKAKTLWRAGDKQQAFDQVCEINLFLSKGIARLFLDLGQVVKELGELSQKVTPK